MSAGRVLLWSGVRLWPTSKWTLRWARDRTRPQCREACYGDGQHPHHACMLWHDGQEARLFSGHSVHWASPEVSKPSHHLTATWNCDGSRWSPWRSHGGIDNQEAA